MIPLEKPTLAMMQTVTVLKHVIDAISQKIPIRTSCCKIHVITVQKHIVPTRQTLMEIT